MVNYFCLMWKNKQDIIAVASNTIVIMITTHIISMMIGFIIARSFAIILSCKCAKKP